MNKPTDIDWIGHWRVKVRYDNAEEIPIEDVIQEILKWKPCAGHVPTGRYDSSLVMNPMTFEPIRVYRVVMIDPNCQDVCCLGTYDLYLSIEA